MIRLALIAAHAALRKATRIAARAANVPSDGHVAIHLGQWCAVQYEYVMRPGKFGLTRDPIDRIDRGLVLAIATHSWHDGGAEIYVLLAAREATGDDADAMMKAYDEEFDRQIEEDSQ